MAQKIFQTFFAKNALEPENLLYYLLIDTNFMTIAPYLPKLWLFKDYGYPKKKKILTPIIPKIWVREQKKLVWLHVSPRGTP